MTPLEGKRSCHGVAVSLPGSLPRFFLSRLLYHPFSVPTRDFRLPAAAVPPHPAERDAAHSSKGSRNHRRKPRCPRTRDASHFLLSFTRSTREYAEISKGAKVAYVIRIFGQAARCCGSKSGARFAQKRCGIFAPDLLPPVSTTLLYFSGMAETSGRNGLTPDPAVCPPAIPPFNPPCLWACCFECCRTILTKEFAPLRRRSCGGL